MDITSFQITEGGIGLAIGVIGIALSILVYRAIKKIMKVLLIAAFIIAIAFISIGQVSALDYAVVKAQSVFFSMGQIAQQLNGELSQLLTRMSVERFYLIIVGVVVGGFMMTVKPKKKRGSKHASK